jgi:hypothetical protein
MDDYIRPNNTQSPPPAHELLRRQFSNTCPTNFHACNNLGAPGLCCASEAVCSADANGNVACCPTGAECSGTINGVIHSGTVNQYGSVVAATGSGTSSFVRATGSTGEGLVPASTRTTATSAAAGGASTTGDGFIIDGTSTVASPGMGARAVGVVSTFVACLILWHWANRLAAVICEDNNTSGAIFANLTSLGLKFGLYSTAIRRSMADTSVSRNCTAEARA